MTAEQKPSSAIVKDYVPAREPPTKTQMKLERERQLLLQTNGKVTPDIPTFSLVEFLAWSAKDKFRFTGLLWLASGILMGFGFWLDFGGYGSTATSSAIMLFFLAWPVPLFFLIMWLWQALRKK
jgi:hypothetical protein